MNETTHFGLSAIRFSDASTKAQLATLRVPGEFKATLMTPLVPTVGGAPSYPVGARKARSEGTLTITLNERPPELEALLCGTTIASNDLKAFNVATLNDGFASNVNNNDKPAFVETATNPFSDRFSDGLYLEIYVNMKGAQLADITLISAHGVVHLNNFAMQANAELPNYGLRLSKQTPNALVAGWIRYRVAANLTEKSFSIPQIASNRDYTVTVWTAEGGTSDSQRSWTFNRCQFSLPDVTATDNEPSAGIELAGILLAPANGDPVVDSRIIE